MIQNTYFMQTGPSPLMQWRDSPSRSSESIIKVKWQLAWPGPGGDLQQLSTLSSLIKGNGRHKNFDNEEKHETKSNQTGIHHVKNHMNEWKNDENHNDKNKTNDNV